MAISDAKPQHEQNRKIAVPADRDRGKRPMRIAGQNSCR